MGEGEEKGREDQSGWWGDKRGAEKRRCRVKELREEVGKHEERDREGNRETETYRQTDR